MSELRCCILASMCCTAPQSHSCSAQTSVLSHDAVNPNHTTRCLTPLPPLQGVHELGEDDDPLNAWCWGEKGEIFQYTMAGTHSTQSGGGRYSMMEGMQQQLHSLVCVKAYNSCTDRRVACLPEFA